MLNILPSRICRSTAVGLRFPDDSVFLRREEEYTDGWLPMVQVVEPQLKKPMWSVPIVGGNLS